MPAPTIYDVARIAGVSHQTVTRYLHGFEGISPETRQRVADALSEVNYQPNIAARFLRSRWSNRIMVFTDRIDQNGPARVLLGANELARERGYFLDIVMADGVDPKSVARSLDTLLAQPTAGILATAKTQVVIEEIKNRSTQIPLVIETEASENADGPAFNELAGRYAADHLLDLGHREVGYLAGPEIYLASQERLTGFTGRIRERGGAIRWVRHGDWSPESGYAAWDSLSDPERAVTAVGASNDSMAMGIIAAARASDIGVPSQLSVIGFDNLPEARFTQPPVTTVEMDFETEGRTIMAVLIAKIEGAPEPEMRQPGNPYVIARESTGRPPAG
ncbi:MAG: LacI family transcriptional regulator [Bifidobacteriaceae bacterium]|jgi:DNA-binding LacI/PurR family transcriptional regulator|nr:LacI family transcriptional regulator [Bifidobacteriaceae bacterium]